MKKTAILLLFSAVLVYACVKTNAQSSVITIVDSEKTTELLSNDKIQLIDVRTVREYQSGRITGSTLIPINDPTFSDKISMLDKEKPVLIYCARGGRSNKASEMMAEMGFKEIYDLKEGITGWIEKGNPIEK